MVSEQKETNAALVKTAPSVENNKTLSLVIGQLEKRYGKGAIMRLGDGSVLETETISSGSLGLDIALGGGLPVGRITEIYGPESSGKTSVALAAIAEAQKLGKSCAFIDAEHALDIRYAQKLGVDIDNLLIARPGTGEQALEITDALIRSGAIGVVVVDSVAALTPQAEIEGEIGDSHMGTQARLMSQAMRKMAGYISDTKTLVIFINQMRVKTDVFFGNPETTTGGNALKFYASVRLDVRRFGQVRTLVAGEKEPAVIGSEVRVKVVKNKVAPPFKSAEFHLMFDEGIQREGELLNLGVKAKLVGKSGAWFDYQGEKIGKDQAQAVQWLKHNIENARDLERQIRAFFLPDSGISPFNAVADSSVHVETDTAA